MYFKGLLVRALLSQLDTTSEALELLFLCLSLSRSSIIAISSLSSPCSMTKSVLLISDNAFSASLFSLSS